LGCEGGGGRTPSVAIGKVEPPVGGAESSGERGWEQSRWRQNRSAPKKFRRRSELRWHGWVRADVEVAWLGEGGR